MIRNLKGFGAALLLAVFAMSAVAASAASAAPGVLTSDGPVKLTGTSAGGAATAFGFKVECHEHATVGAVGETPHGFLTPPVSSFTVQTQSTNCVATIGVTIAPATVTTNGCDGVTKIGETISAEKWGGTGEIVCPESKQIEIHAYTNSAHTSSICTVKIPPQTGLTGGSVENIAGGKITLGGTVKGIKATKTGVLCGGTAETNSAEVHGDAVVSGTSNAGEATAISISD
jgi:hypothetical protein